MKRLLIYDLACPNPYDWSTLFSRPQGGTESTVTRVAEGLALNRKVSVTVAQHCRFTSATSPNEVKYVRIEPKLFKNKYDVIVSLRDTNPLALLKPHYPNAISYLWAHDLSHTWLTEGIKHVTDTKSELIAVSDFHKTNLTEAIKAISPEVPKVHRLYNPVSTTQVDMVNKPINPNKLVFLSSPHKGLDITIYLFECALRINPQFKLYVFNPGYLNVNYKTHPNVIFMPPTPQHLVLEFIQDSLCVFYPNTVFPETFGLVFSEANAVGVPVLAHRFGAASEILGGPPQVIDCRNQSLVLDTLMSWYDGNRPTVTMNPTFSLANVISDWHKLLLR